jgi:hypothetical protein
MDVMQEVTLPEVGLSVEWLDDHRSQCLQLPASWLMPFQDAIAMAISTQAVYWVGCPAGEWPAVATFQDDAGLQRLLRAIATGQTVSRPRVDQVSGEESPG